MQIRIVPGPLSVVGLTLAVSLCVAGNVGAQTYTWTASPNGGNPTVNVAYENAAGNGLKTDSGVPAEAFSITSGSTTLTAFCIDLWHTQSNNSFSTITNIAVNSANSGTIATLFEDPKTTGAALTNELNYIGSLLSGTTPVINMSSANQVGAVQLALWSLVSGGATTSPGFSYSSFSNTQVQADYNAIAAQIGLAQFTSGQGSTTASFNNTLTTYNSGTTYAAGTVINVNGGPSSNTGFDQNVITWGATPQVAGTPEPSSFAIAGVGALAFVGYGLRRRKVARKCG
jgi:hypothetical protein